MSSLRAWSGVPVIQSSSLPGPAMKPSSVVVMYRTTFRMAVILPWYVICPAGRTRDLHRVKWTVCAKLYTVSSSQPYGDPETRERLLQAAWNLALEQGPSLRLADVAARAGA